MSQDTPSETSLLATARAAAAGADSDRDLFGQTIRMVAILVAACVLFVGGLSVAAVTITSKAVGSDKASSSEVSGSDRGPTQRGAGEVSTKKPVSI
jgi:hypothetical protein